MWCLPAICRSYSERENMGFPRCRISLPQGRSYYLMWLYYIMIVSFNSIICISYGYMICIYDKFPKKNPQKSAYSVYSSGLFISPTKRFQWFHPTSCHLLARQHAMTAASKAAVDLQWKFITHGELRWGRSLKIPSGYVKIAMENGDL